MGADEVNGFLSSLAVDDDVSVSTQNQALSALLFLYRPVLDEPLPWLNEIVRATCPVRLPVVLTPDEVRAVLIRMSGPAATVALLLYGSGLRLLEALQLRAKDLDSASPSCFPCVFQHMKIGATRRAVENEWLDRYATRGSRSSARRVGTK